ncbi:hypothetical protein PZH33_18975, partial [Blautia schinkii]|nr:hypothetical protein [Blautia schinkii]
MFLEAPDDWIEKIYVAESMLEDEEVMKKVRRFSWKQLRTVCSGRCVIHRRHRESLPYSDSLLTNWKIFCKRKNHFLWFWRICKIPEMQGRSSEPEKAPE